LTQPKSIRLCVAQVRALPAPPKKERIGYLPYDAPLHRIHPKDMLPVRLLTPFQAENDYHVKDTYNYMTVQTDIRQPKRHLDYIEDAYFHDIWERALRVAVDRIQVRALRSKAATGCRAGGVRREVLVLGVLVDSKSLSIPAAMEPVEPLNALSLTRSAPDLAARRRQRTCAC